MSIKINVISTNGYPTYAKVESRQMSDNLGSLKSGLFPFTMLFTGGASITFDTEEDFINFSLAVQVIEKNLKELKELRK